MAAILNRNNKVCAALKQEWNTTSGVNIGSWDKRLTLGLYWWTTGEKV